MVEHAPATGGLALWMRHRDVDEDGAAVSPHRTDRATGAPTGAVDAHDPTSAAPASTDGHEIVYTAAFATLPLAEQTGWVAHEVLHVALRHPQRLAELRERLGDVDDRLFNTCADAIVDSALDHLAWLVRPRTSPRLDTLLVETLAIHQDVGRSLLEWDVERLYRAIDDRMPDRDGRTKRDGPRAARVRALGAGQPRDLRASHAERESPERRAERDHEWGERLARAHAGDGEHSMLRALLADLPGSRVPWEQVLRTRLARALVPRAEVSWSRPSRSWLANRGRGPHGRMPFEPGRVSTRRAPRIAVIVDVSGSIDDALLDRFAHELGAIARHRGAAIVLVAGDDRVRHVERLEPGDARALSLRFEGGGGTDFAPLLRGADQHRPDVGVVLTDLEGPAAYRPRWPVVWAVPMSRVAAVAPFGRVLVLD